MKRKMKILYVHHGSGSGGAPRSLAFLIKQLDKEKYEAYVVCHHEFEKCKELFEEAGAKVIHVRYMGGWYGSTVSPMSWATLFYNITHVLPSYFGIKKIVKDIKPDIIHLNSTCLCYVARSIKKSFPQIPIVCHVREPILDGFWGNILRRNCEKAVDRYIAIDQYDAKSLHTKKHVDIIYNFVDFSLYNESVISDCLRTELGLGKDQIILLYLARVCPENGALELTRSIEQFLNERKNVHLCIVGANINDNSDYMKSLTQYVKSSNNIHLLGFRDDIPQVIASTDIMVVPFQVPHFARSIIEAAAMGVPSIASDIGGVNELIINGETGYLLDYLTFYGIDEVCKKMIDDPNEYKRLSRNSIVYAHRNFDSKINAQRTTLVYHQLIK